MQPFFRFVGLVALLCAGTAYAQGLPGTVQTRNGAVRGEGADVVAFRGIPYAAPPIGQLRWRAPAEAKPWSGVRDATRFGPRCPQPTGAGDPVAINEDCLTLNVWTPARSADQRLPVMVWIHGGGFRVNAGSMFDGQALARRGVVVVTINYRLGALGFLAHPALSLESPHGVSGNYGLLDQIAALQWVKANIGAFGGDAANVTVFGESAGAWSTIIHLTSPLSRGLVHRVIAQSAPRVFGMKQKLRAPYYGRASAESVGAGFGSDIAALRALPAEEVLRRLEPASTFSNGLLFSPIVDGYVMPVDPEDLLGTEAHAAIPAIIGYAEEEGLFWKAEAPTTLAAYHDFLANRFAAESIPAIEAMYPARNDAEAHTASIRMFGESQLVAASLLTARRLAARGSVYVYQFARASPSSRKTWGGATHTTYIPYMFDTIPDDRSAYETRDVVLAKQMADAFVQFAKTGRPAAAGLTWPAYRAPEYREVRFGDSTELGSNAGLRQVELFARAFEAAKNRNSLSQ